MSIVKRFTTKILPNTSCWEWDGAILKNGYGQLKGVKKVEYAHRIAYALFYGPVPDGLVIDHLCRNRGCVNPLHLEAVSNKENLLRGIGFSAKNAKKTHCPKGHELSGNNLLTCPSILKKGNRQCKACWRIRDAITYQKKKNKTL